MTEVTELHEDSITVVREFFAAMTIEDTHEAVALCAPDVVWRNTTLPTVRGAVALRRALSALARSPLQFAADFHAIAADGDTVLTQRTDHLSIGPVRISFWVCGTFELRDGKITLWDDYFSWENVLRGTVVGLVRAALGR